MSENFDYVRKMFGNATEFIFANEGEAEHLPAYRIKQLERFDKAIAEHDREVAEKAWDEGNNQAWEDCENGAEFGEPNPYRKEGK